MEGKPHSNLIWMLKTVTCLMFFGLFAARTQAGLGLPPVIIVPPLGLAVQNGGIAILTTTAVSLTPMQFTWLLNGKPIPTTNTAVVTLLGVSTLTVDPISSATAGNYSVQIKNGGGTTTGTAVVIVLTTTVSNVVNFVTTGTGLTPGGFKIQLSGPSGSNYVIQASSDLKTWVPIFTNTAPSGSLSYTDAVANSLSFRYYRAKIQ